VSTSFAPKKNKKLNRLIEKELQNKLSDQEKIELQQLNQEYVLSRYHDAFQMSREEYQRQIDQSNCSAIAVINEFLERTLLELS
jgi:HEPN domain-containing protein